MQEIIEVEIREEAEFNIRGGFSAERGVQGLHNRAEAEVQVQEYYKFTTWQVV